MDTLKETQRLLEVVHDLRTKCPWDKEQTHKTLVPYLLEEAYETIDAIDDGTPEEFREELGDLLLQVALHAEIASERMGFRFEDVAKAIADKMVRRHPHIYGDVKYTNQKQHKRLWTELKAKEKPKRSRLDGIPKAMPALQLAQRYGEIASSVGFDWDKVEAVLAKVKEEMKELETEIKRRNRKREAVAMELGDVLFTIANLARHLKVNAEMSLKQSAKKFAQRFSELEKREDFSDATWESVKSSPSRRAKPYSSAKGARNRRA